MLRGLFSEFYGSWIWLQRKKKTEKTDLKFITNEKINFETNGAPYKSF